MEKNQVKTKKGMTKRTQEILFLCVALAFPITHFLVMYVGVNANSILLSLKEYVGQNQYVFAGLKNFEKIINLFVTNPDYGIMIKNSVIMWFCSSPMTILLGMLIAYSVWKKVYFSGFFSTILFLPSMISSVIFVMILEIMIGDLLPSIHPALGELLVNAESAFFTLLGYDRLLSFGITMIYFMGAMSAISSGLVEYGKIEGVNAFQEFTHIVIPAVWPTVVSLLVVGFAQLFVNYGLLLAYYGTSAPPPAKTLGYQIYIMVKSERNLNAYPEAAAMGLLFTMITIPIVFTVKHLLEKFGPRED